MNIEEKVYYEKGAVIEVMEQKALMIYPNNVENNFANLENGNFKINWMEVINMYEKYITKQTNFELKIIIFGKLMLATSFASYAAMQSFFIQLDRGLYKIQWKELLDLAKNKDYPAKLSF